jgi:small subunit ribosomal protein S3
MTVGQKTNPVGLRLGISRGWNSVWFARGRKYCEHLEEDARLRKYILKRLEKAQISRVEIERKPQEVQVTIHTARAGLVIGSKGSTIDQLTKELKYFTGKTVRTKVEEIRQPERDASLVADSIARQVESRVSIRRAMKRAISDAMKAGAEGITYHEGRVPLHTLRADIDFSRSIARTTYGVIGVKVWIYNGEVHDYPGQSGPAE